MHVLSDHFEWEAEHIPVVLRDYLYLSIDCDVIRTMKLTYNPTLSVLSISRRMRFLVGRILQNEDYFRFVAYPTMY